jgi:tRNA(fMet)-specific endonuclease VapC
LEPLADHNYAEIRWQLTLEGTPIGPNDLQIAAQALSLGLTIVTANVGELSHVPGLQVENWLED